MWLEDLGKLTEKRSEILELQGREFYSVKFSTIRIYLVGLNLFYLKDTTS